MKIQKTFEIEDKLYSEFLNFCSLNDIQDSDSEFIKFFITGFNIAKYGISPFVKNDKPTEIKEKKENKVSSVVKTEEKEQPIVENQEVKPKKRVRIIKN